MQQLRLEHRFVQYIPEHIIPGVLYISIDYNTAVHSCCCGCGEEVVTPFSPKGWKMTFDGETVSLWPSIGNWNFHCQSHYVVERSQVLDLHSRTYETAGKEISEPNVSIAPDLIERRILSGRLNQLWSSIMAWIRK